MSTYARTWNCARVDEGQEGSKCACPTCKWADLLMQYQGQPFAGIAVDVMANAIRGELSYVDDLRDASARDRDASGRLRAEDPGAPTSAMA
jgi:hypothetical protein